jgi:hypothetical protein
MSSTDVGCFLALQPRKRCRCDLQGQLAALAPPAGTAKQHSGVSLPSNGLFNRRTIGPALLSQPNHGMSPPFPPAAVERCRPVGSAHRRNKLRQPLVSVDCQRIAALASPTPIGARLVARRPKGTHAAGINTNVLTPLLCSKNFFS